MIDRIEIDNFKSIKKANIKVSNLNLLMGLNGMGKSTFIQTLLLLMQSDKIEDGILDLNGILTQIGQGKDALYQYADEEKIVLELIFEGQPKYSWKFDYQFDKEKLVSENNNTKDQMGYFQKVTKKFQYIRAERIGPIDIYEASNVVVQDKRQLGLLGEYAAHFISFYGQEFEVNEKLRHYKASSINLLSQLNSWMKEISPGISLNAKYVADVNKVILDYQFDFSNGRTNSFKPKNVGFGISYVLPIVLSLLTAEKGKIIVIENPESHIHPRGQAELGKLISLAASIGVQLFVETHSDHILNGIRVSVKNALVDKSKVNVMYFEKTSTQDEQFTEITQIKIDANGELSEYPKNMIDEWSNQLLKLL